MTRSPRTDRSAVVLFFHLVNVMCVEAECMFRLLFLLPGPVVTFSVLAHEIICMGESDYLCMSLLKQ